MCKYCAMSVKYKTQMMLKMTARCVDDAVPVPDKWLLMLWSNLSRRTYSLRDELLGLLVNGGLSVGDISNVTYKYKMR